MTQEEESSPLPPVESIKEPTIEDEKPAEQPQPTTTVEVAAQTATTADLLVSILSFIYFSLLDFLSYRNKFILCVIMQGLDEINPVAAELEESNALALAIIPSGDSVVNNTFIFLKYSLEI